LRPKGGEVAIILDLVGNIAAHGLPDQPHEWNLHAEKRKSGKPQQAPVRTCLGCYAYSPATAPRCVHCGKAWPIKPRSVAKAVAGELVELERGREAMLLPKVKLSEKEVTAAVRGCKNLWELQRVAKRLGYKSGWAWKQWGLKQKAATGFDPKEFERELTERLIRTP
jgi:hypothetical protein